MRPPEEEDEDHADQHSSFPQDALAPSHLLEPRGYPNVLPTSPPYNGLLHPRPIAAGFFPHADDSMLTSSVKLGNIATGLAFTLAMARGSLAAVLAPHARRTAFVHGFAATFPIYLPAFLLGAFADHAFRKVPGKEGRQGRTFAYDLP